MKQTIKLNEKHLHNIIQNCVRKTLKENFEDDYNKARDNYKRPCWGFEMKNKEGEWEYGDVTFDPKSMTMSCMGVSIDVDPEMSVDDNLEGLFDELCNNGYTNESRTRKNHHRRVTILSEAKLDNIVRKSMKKVLKENFDDDVNNMVENEKVGKQFIDFIEKYHGGVLLQTVVDYETGNETGEPTSPLPTLIPEFEDAYGIECTTDMRKEIKRQYNQWWYYAEPLLVGEE